MSLAVLTQRTRAVLNVKHVVHEVGVGVVGHAFAGVRCTTGVAVVQEEATN